MPTPFQSPSDLAGRPDFETLISDLSARLVTAPDEAFDAVEARLALATTSAGALWNQVWSFSGNSTRADVNQMFLQPFLTYQASRTWTMTLLSETTANWEVDEGRWTVPINIMVGKLSSFGTFPASYQFGGGVFVVHPDTGPSWKVRGAIIILLPRRR